MLLTLLAARLNRRPPVSAAASMAQMLRELPPPVKSPLATPAVPTAVSKPAASAAAPAVAPSAVNLPEAAELCGDLARVIDGRDVPGLLARAAKLLEASGVIVWMADSDGQQLHPTLTHGYSDKVLSRLGRTRRRRRQRHVAGIPGRGDRSTSTARARPARSRFLS